MSVDLSVASLSYSNFAGAMAGYADFSGSEMESVEASHGEFAYATFAQANLDSASFIFADLRNADLSGADLRNADFSGADLRGADLRNATTLGTRFEGAISSSTTLWPEAFLGPSHREERGLDELAETATIDLRSHRALVGGVAAVAMLTVGLSFAKATGTDPVAPSKVEVLGERANRVSYLVTGTAAVVEITLTNELNGSEVFEAITPFHRIMSVPQGYQLELRAKVQGNGSATCSIEGALWHPTERGSGARRGLNSGLCSNRPLTRQTGGVTKKATALSSSTPGCGPALHGSLLACFSVSL